jgi:dihydrofolate reductase
VGKERLHRRRLRPGRAVHRVADAEDSARVRDTAGQRLLVGRYGAMLSYMSRLVWMMSVSVDGYMQAPGGDLSWQSVDEEVHDEFNAVLRPMAAFLEGRVMYQMMEAYWPTADADPNEPRPVLEFAGIWRDKQKLVYTSTLDEVGPNATIVRDVVPAEVVALKAAAGGDLSIGGARLAKTFLRYGLVDELRLYVHPVVLGRGTPLFPPSDEPVRLTLTETKTFGNGVALLRYDVAGGRA